MHRYLVRQEGLLVSEHLLFHSWELLNLHWSSDIHQGLGFETELPGSSDHCPAFQQGCLMGVCLSQEEQKANMKQEEETAEQTGRTMTAIKRQKML